MIDTQKYADPWPKSSSRTSLYFKTYIGHGLNKAFTKASDWYIVDNARNNHCEMPHHICQAMICQHVRYIATFLQTKKLISWWRHQMETFSALLALWVENSSITGEFPSQRPVTVGQILETQVIWDAIAFIMTSLYCEWGMLSHLKHLLKLFITHQNRHPQPSVAFPNFEPPSG